MKSAQILPSFPAYEWGKACSALPLIEDATLSLKREEMPPGTSEAPHFHTIARQYFYILSGEATFLVPDGPLKVVQGETLFVPPGLPHRICNQSSGRLDFIVLSLPSTNGDRTNLAEIPPSP